MAERREIPPSAVGFVAVEVVDCENVTGWRVVIVIAARATPTGLILRSFCDCRPIVRVIVHRVTRHSTTSATSVRTPIPIASQVIVDPRPF